MNKVIPVILPKMPEVMAVFWILEKKMTKIAFNSIEICNFASSCYKKAL